MTLIELRITAPSSNPRTSVLQHGETVTRSLWFGLLMSLLGLTICTQARADSLADVCHASSTYDLTVQPTGLTFDRAVSPPRKVWMHAGALRVDGTNAKLNTEDRDRVRLFERDVRALLPRVKAIAAEGVDLAERELRKQIGILAPSAAAGGVLDQRINADVADIKARIASSNSTHDFQGTAFDQYANKLVTDIVPLIAADMGQQAIDHAMSGDLQSAAHLRDQALHVASTLEAKLRQSLQPLRPQIRALCPDIQSLDTLESGMTSALPTGGRLNLIEIDTPPDSASSR